MRRVAAILLAMLTGAPAWAEEADLREFRVGMTADELPAEGYADFACAGAGRVGGWQDYRRCPTDAAGLHKLRFSYQEGSNELAFLNDTYEGTKVGGHPVLLTLLISDAGVVEGLRIETDPAARLNRRKKAYLLGDLAKARYGEGGVRPRGSGRPGTRSGITHEISSRLCIKIYGYPARSLSM